MMEQNERGSRLQLPMVRAGGRRAGHRRRGGHRAGRQRLLFQGVDEGDEAVGGDQLKAHQPVGGAVTAHKVGQDNGGGQANDLR